MSPLRRHGGGRPRTADSIQDVAERWGISQRSARRLAARKLSDDAIKGTIEITGREDKTITEAWDALRAK